MRADDTLGARRDGRVAVSRKRLAARIPCVYILARKRNGTLYIGVTSDLVRRVWEHRNDLVAGFSQRYRTAWFWRAPLAMAAEGMEARAPPEAGSVSGRMESAIVRERRLKEWKRAWKLELIEEENPVWRDLYREIL